MVGRFSEEQKSILEKAIIKESRQLFQTFGYNKTSIQDITKKVGIAQGTFYTFFPSKADLYFIILELEEKELREHFLRETKLPNENNVQFIARMITNMVHFIELNPILSELLIENQLNKMINRLSTEVVTNHIKNDGITLLPLITHWRNMGITFQEDSRIIAAILRSIFVLTTHKEEIGADEYDKTIKLFIESIVKKVVQEEEESQCNE